MDAFKSKKFKDEKLEKLYQRYFFKLTQTSMTVIMAFLSIIAITDVAFYYLSGATLPVSGVVLGVVVLILLILEVSLLLFLSLCVRSEAELF